MRDLPTTHMSLLMRLEDRDDRTAWEEFVRTYSPVLERMAIHGGLRGLDADELVQEVFVLVMKNIGRFEHTNRDGAFRKWLITIAKNALLNKCQRIPRDAKHRAPAGELEFLMAEDKDKVSWIGRSFEREWQKELFLQASQVIRSQVSPIAWDAFWYTAVEGRTGAEVAELLGVGVGSVYVARSRTLAKIKNWVAAQQSRWEGSR